MPEGIEHVEYDEFAYFQDNAASSGSPTTARRRFAGSRSSCPTDGGSAHWCGATGEPELVLLHGGAQNAHTWDTVALALGRPLVAIDLPGHGHSDGPRRPADSLARASRRRRGGGDRGARPGGPGRRRHVARRPHDHRPGRRSPPSSCAVRRSSTSRPASTRKGQGDHRLRRRPGDVPELRRDPRPHDRAQPDPDRASLRRGILHNAVQLDDGSWVWRYRRWIPGGAAGWRRSYDTRSSIDLWDTSRLDHRAADAGARHAPAVGGRRRRRGRTAASAARAPASSTSPKPATASRATRRSSWPG